MLSWQSILSYYPDSLQKFERSILREYLQYKILATIFESKFAHQLSFLGGTALRIAYDNTRFSEDLDFDNSNLTKDDFEELMLIVQRSLELQGLVVEIRNVYKGAYHCYIKFSDLLYRYGLTPQKREKILIRLDTVSQNFAHQADRILLNKFDVFTEVLVTPLDVLLSQKILASLERKRAKGRDFFDIVFLLGKGIRPNLDFLDQKLGVGSIVQALEVLLKKTAQLDMKKMALDVQPFLFSRDDAKKVELFPQVIKQALAGS